MPSVYQYTIKCVKVDRKNLSRRTIKKIENLRSVEKKKLRKVTMTEEIVRKKDCVGKVK